MIRLFPPATEEDLKHDNLCIICRDEMTEGRKLPCGHIFHSECFDTWILEHDVYSYIEESKGRVDLSCVPI